jgi:hypothetical protein
VIPVICTKYHSYAGLFPGLPIHVRRADAKTFLEAYESDSRHDDDSSCSDNDDESKSSSHDNRNRDIDKDIDVAMKTLFANMDKSKQREIIADAKVGRLVYYIGDMILQKTCFNDVKKVTIELQKPNLNIEQKQSTIQTTRDSTAINSKKPEKAKQKVTTTTTTTKRSAPNRLEDPNFMSSEKEEILKVLAQLRRGTEQSDDQSRAKSRKNGSKTKSDKTDNVRSAAIREVTTKLNTICITHICRR